MITSFVIHGKETRGEVFIKNNKLWFKPEYRQAVPVDLVAETIGREKGLLK